MLLSNKKLFAFDLDGTLAASKSRMDSEMAELILCLVDSGKMVAVISGGALPQYEKQFLGALNASSEQLKKIFLFPTCGAAFYRYENNSWKLVYEEKLTNEEAGKIRQAFATAFVDVAYAHPPAIFGELIEFRGTQMTFSALGQEAPLELKAVFDPDGQKRKKLQSALAKYIPEFDVKLGGSTSLDVTRKGVDKAYGIEQMMKHLGAAKEEIIFFGDAIFPGGNDYPVKVAGVDCVPVSGYNETKLKLGALFK